MRKRSAFHSPHLDPHFVIRGALEIEEVGLFIPSTDTEMPTVCWVLGKALEIQR